LRGGQPPTPGALRQGLFPEINFGQDYMPDNLFIPAEPVNCVPRRFTIVSTLFNTKRGKYYGMIFNDAIPISIL
jgi:hypothetical protein